MGQPSELPDEPRRYPARTVDALERRVTGAVSEERRGDDLGKAAADEPPDDEPPD